MFWQLSLIVILRAIKKEITEMNLDIDCVIRCFSHLNVIFYIGWTRRWILAFFHFSTLNYSPMVPNGYLNKLWFT